jgi:hypothetical protein
LPLVEICHLDKLPIDLIGSAKTRVGQAATQQQQQEQGGRVTRRRPALDVALHIVVTVA